MMVDKRRNEIDHRKHLEGRAGMQHEPQNHQQVPLVRRLAHSQDTCEKEQSYSIDTF